MSDSGGRQVPDRRALEWLRFVGWVLLGYALAVTVAVVVVIATIAVPATLPDGGRFGSIHSVMRDLFAFLFAGMLYTAITAWPGYLLTLTWGFKRDRRSVRYFALCGLPTTLLATLLFGYFSGATWMAALALPRAVPGIYLGGFLGAMAYGHLIGRWLEWPANARDTSTAQPDSD